MNMQLVKCFQYTDEAKSKEQANEFISFLKSQTDFIGGRILEPTPSRGWFVQTFFEDHETNNMPLPDGVRRVLCPKALLERAA
jgi:hypothetical protein